MADQVVMENNNNEAEVMEQEAPATRLIKKAGAVAIVALATYGVVSLVKDCIAYGKEIKGAGGMKAYMAQRKFEKETAKEAKNNKN